MKQLSGLDAGFLYMETATTFGHVSGLAVYERPHAEFSPYDAFRDRVQSRLGLLEPMRRRLVPVPLELDHPYWIEDPDFDIDFHVRHMAVPSPGGDRQLADLVGGIIGRPLDRGHPLWEAYVIEGLANDRWAVLTKVHHATIDGASGSEFMTILLDTEPDAQPDVPPVPVAERVPTPAEMLFRTASQNATRPLRVARAQQRLIKESFELLSKQRGTWFSAPTPTRSLPRTPVAPRTPFNQSISAHRRFAFATSSLDDLKAIKKALGATINDVVMAICAGALRRYLIQHGAGVDRPLVAGVPVSIRTGEEAEKWTNRVSMIIGDLPVHLDDPLERLAAARASMGLAKEAFDAVPADALADFTQFSPPAVFTAASRMAANFRVGDLGQQTINLVISNVPGPRETLYLSGAPLVHYYPVSTIAEGQGLNITVQSYQDIVDFGLVGCRELVPDIWDLMDMIRDEIEALLAATADIRAAATALPTATDAATALASETSAAKKAGTNKSAAKAAATPTAGTKAATADKAVMKAAAGGKAVTKAATGRKAVKKAVLPND